MTFPFLRMAALAVALITPLAARAQTAPEFPGLRGLTTLQAYIGFIGRPAAIAECGFTEAFLTELMNNVAHELGQVGVTVAPGSERVPMNDGLLMRTPGYTVGLPTLAITSGTMSVNPGQGPLCGAAIGLALRANGSGTVTATGTRYEGDMVIWMDDAAQLRDAGSITTAVRNSIVSAMQGLATAIRAANPAGAVTPGVMACPGPLNAVPNAPARFNCACSAGAAAAGASIWGFDVYTDDSDICVAAMHAGAISRNGGVVTVSRAPGQQSYRGGARNEILSSTYGPWQQSFRVTAADEAMQAPVPGNARAPVTM